MTIPRLRQSTAKVLVMECPAIGYHQYMQEQREPTRAMEKGTLVDQLVFGGLNFHTIDAKDYRTKKAQEERDGARERGQVPVLAGELDEAKQLAGLIKSRLLDEGIDLGKCLKQHYIEWTTLDGCPAAGTPDLVLIGDGTVQTIDLKVGHTANPDRLEQHLYDQGWHIQGAAYQEAYGFQLGCSRQNGKDYGWRMPGQHWLVCAEAKSGANCITVAPLSPAYIELGMNAWKRAQKIWQHGWATNEWPEYKSRPLMPTKSVMFREGMSA